MEDRAPTKYEVTAEYRGRFGQIGDVVNQERSMAPDANVWLRFPGEEVESFMRQEIRWIGNPGLEARRLRDEIAGTKAKLAVLEAKLEGVERGSNGR